MTAGAQTAEDLNNTMEILYLPCAKLEDHPLRLGYYAESHLEELVLSIRETGLLEPLVVCPTENGTCRILSGHYRIRAVRRLRWKQVLCRVINCDMRTSAVIYCTSNLLTRGLGSMEEAHIITHMVSQEHFTLEEIGKLWGRSKSWVSRRMGLLVHLQPQLRKDLAMGYLSPRMAQELFRLPRGNEQDRVLHIIRREHLNKDEAARLIGDWLSMDEEGKKRMERKTFLTAITPATNKDITFAREQLDICVQSVTRMMDVLLETSWLGAVPAGDWHAYRRLVRILRCKVENLSFERR